jgi:hypothetical protein
MPLFKREKSTVERFTTVLREKHAAREKLANRLRVMETVVSDRRSTAEQLAVTGASDAKLGRAEAELRSVEARAKTLLAELDELDEQIAWSDRALADAMAQRERDVMADQIEAMAAAIELAAPGFGAAATALADAVGKSPASVLEATRFSMTVDAVRREVLAAADLVCWELRSTAVRTRAGNANFTADLAAKPEPPVPEIDRQLIYTLNPLLWREGGEVRKARAFALIDLPRNLLSVALQHRLVDHLNARRVQTLIQVHGGGGDDVEDPADPQPIDLDSLVAGETQVVQADVA